MTVTKGIWAATAAMAVTACASQQQMVESMQAEAIHTAERRGVFELNCPAAKGEMLSNEMIQSPIMNPRFAPPQRAEYTIGVAGCGQRTTYLVICAEGGTGCYAAGARNVIRQ